MTHPSRAPEDVQQRQDAVERLTRAGRTITQICEETALSRTSVVRIRRQRQVARSKRSPLTADETKRARRLLDDGASIAEVVRTLGCGRSQIGDRFPGRAWSLQQTLDYQRIVRELVGNHSAVPPRADCPAHFPAAEAEQ